jgi:transcription elongation factor Elf1
MEKSQYVMKSQRRKKMTVVEKFGGKCCICGYDKCINALEFHHLDKKLKEEKPSYIIMRWSWEKVKKELEKCILVCSNCHKELHFSEIDITPGKFFKPWIDKICEYCHKDYETKDVEQKYCSPTCWSLSNRKVERPTKEILKELIENDVSLVKIGEMFGVSGNAVKKWIIKYDII